MIRANTFKAKLRTRRQAVGCWLYLGEASITEVLGSAGFDAFLVDQEHGQGALSEALPQLRAAAPFPTTMLVRVASHDPAGIKRVLDAGFEGVIVPGVESAEQARAVVDACRYPPAGRRGAAGMVRAGDYGRGWTDYLRQHVAELMIIVQIELAAAVERVPEIARVEGIDMLFIGPLDLSASIGKPGQFDDPEVAALLDRAERAIKASGKWLGGIELGASDRLLKRGYDAVFVTSDLNLLRDGARKLLTDLAKT